MGLGRWRGVVRLARRGRRVGIALGRGRGLVVTRVGLRAGLTVSLGTLGRVLMGGIRIYTVTVGRGGIILAVVFVVSETQAAKVIGDAVGKLFEEGHAALRYVTVDAKNGERTGEIVSDEETGAEYFQSRGGF